MGKAKYSVAANPRHNIISSTGVKKGAVLLGGAPWSRPNELEPEKQMSKAPKITSTFAVATGTLKYDLCFTYVLEKFVTGMGSEQWFPKKGWIKLSAKNYKGPKTHFMEVNLIVNKVSNVGGGKNDMPCVHFQLEQWYGPIIPVPGGGSKVITNGQLRLGAGKVTLAKSKW